MLFVRAGTPVPLFLYFEMLFNYLFALLISFTVTSSSNTSLKRADSLGATQTKSGEVPNAEHAREALQLVAKHGYQSYQDNMSVRTKHYERAREVRNRFLEFPAPPFEEQLRRVAVYRSHRDAGWDAWRKAHHGARTNRIIASITKNVKTTHQPRRNDYRRWGYSPSDSDLSRLSLPSNPSYPRSLVGTPPPRSSRTPSVGPHKSPWEGWEWSHTIKIPKGQREWPTRGRTPSSQSLGGISLPNTRPSSQSSKGKQSPRVLNTQVGSQIPKTPTHSSTLPKSSELRKGSRLPIAPRRRQLVQGSRLLGTSQIPKTPTKGSLIPQRDELREPSRLSKAPTSSHMHKGW